MRPDREGKKMVGGWVPVEQWKKIRHIVTDTQRSQADLISEAIDMLAAKYPGEQPQRATGKKRPRTRAVEC